VRGGSYRPSKAQALKVLRHLLHIKDQLDSVCEVTVEGSLSHFPWGRNLWCDM